MQGEHEEDGLAALESKLRIGLKRERVAELVGDMKRKIKNNEGKIEATYAIRSYTTSTWIGVWVLCG